MARSPASLLHPRQLEAIVAVARVGSVHAAARELGVPQPALSRLVAASEKTLGIDLFARSRSGTHTTPAGERVIKGAAFALNALRSVAQAAHEPLPVVRLGCIPRVMHVLIPHLLAQLSEGKAGFRLQVSVGTSNELVTELDAARVDFVIARRVTPEGEETPELDADKLYSERTVVVCGRENPAVGPGTFHVSQLARLPWVLPKRGFYSRDLIDTIVSVAGQPPIVPVIESNSFESSLSVVAATKFLAMAPEFAARRFEQLQLVRIVPMRPSLGASPIMLQYPPRQRSHPAFEPFRAVAIRAARKVRSSD